ncbi:MAG: UTP--glucose-1-phosphate uridylyltransferase [Thermoguttaceae bacterium]
MPPTPKPANKKGLNVPIHVQRFRALKELTEASGNGHLLAFWDQITLEGQRRLESQIRELDFAQLRHLFERRNDPIPILSQASRAQDPPAYRFSTVDHNTCPPPTAPRPISPRDAKALGEDALRKGKLGVILVAGGQGTRLGFDHPKGMFPIGPVSQHTLFQIHFEKVLAMSQLYGVSIPLCLMTSVATHEETIAFLKQNRFFGLDEQNVFIFRQGTMPALDMETGRVYLESKDSIALSPDGHGGMLKAIATRPHEKIMSVLEAVMGRGVEHLFYFQVDNPLVQIGSPEFFGYHLHAESELTSQVIRKRFPTDRVGNVVSIDGRLHVLEYSDIPDEVAHRTKPDGSLNIWAGSIAVHIFSTAFLNRMAAKVLASPSSSVLPFHTARKKVAYINPERGTLVRPIEPNAVKFERFIFDLLPEAANAVVVEVDTANHYAPLKNPSGSLADSPELVQMRLSDMYTSWLRAASVVVDSDSLYEISPLYALTPELLASKIAARTVLDRSTFLQ